jgi:hypothetical protein
MTPAFFPAPGYLGGFANSDYPYITQDIGMTVGETYRVSFDFVRTGYGTTGMLTSGWRVSIGTNEFDVIPSLNAQNCVVVGVCEGNGILTLTAINVGARVFIKDICVIQYNCECYKITRAVEQPDTLIAWYQFQSCDGVMRISSMNPSANPNPTNDTDVVYISAIQNTLQICAECYSDINQYNQALAASTITLSSDEGLCNQTICENNLVQNWNFSNGFNNWTQTPQNSWILFSDALNPYETLSISFDYYGFWDSVFVYKTGFYENASISQDIGMQVGSNYRVSFYAVTLWPSCININVYLGTNVLQYSNNSNVIYFSAYRLCNANYSRIIEIDTPNFSFITHTN